MTNHMRYIETVINKDIETLIQKEATYGGSWKKRGGVGAFMVMARKWDRIENIMARNAYDIFKAIEYNPFGNDGTVLAEIRDLRCYLTLIEAEMTARGVVLQGDPPPPELNLPGTPEDGGHHSRCE